MIDDFIEGGKVYKKSETSLPEQESLQDHSLLSEVNDSEIFDLSEYGQFGKLWVDRSRLNSIIKCHRIEIKAINSKLNRIYYTVVLFLALT